MKLCGTLIIYQGIKYDYCYLEAIKCLQALCDYTIVVDCGSQDGTAESLKEIENEKTLVIYRDKSEWDIMQGREKLAYYTNIAIDKARDLGYEWQFNLQGDELIHEDCFDKIHELINRNDEEGYWSRRINLWGNCQHQLNVGYDRIPVGIEVLRLTKTTYQSVGDAQSIQAPASWQFLEDIRIYHMGFVRNPYLHNEKIRHMLVEVFLMGGNDPKVEAMGKVFDPWVHFSKSDVEPIKENLPIFVKGWAIERDKLLPSW